MKKKETGRIEEIYEEREGGKGKSSVENTSHIHTSMSITSVVKIPGIIFSGSKYLGYIPRYLFEVNTFDQGVLGIISMPEYLPR